MLKNIFLLLLISLYGTSAFTQKNCSCPGVTDANRNTLDAATLLRSGDPSCKIQGYRIIARGLLIRRELDSAEVFINKALEILAANNCVDEDYLIFYQMMDNLYANRSDFKGAIDMELKIVSIFEKKKDTLNYCRGLLNVSNIFNEVKQADKGINYCRSAIVLIKQLDPSPEKAVLLARAAQRYFAYYNQYGSSSYLDSTELYATAGLDVIKQVPFEKEATITVNNRLITVATVKQQYDKALKYIDQNLSLCDRSKDFPELSVTFKNKAEVFYKMQQYNTAMQFADSLLTYNQLLKSPAATAETWQLIAKIAEASGNSSKALEAYKQERLITDSIGTAQRTAAVAELEKKYNQAKNEKTIKELAQQKQIYLLLAIAGLLVLVAIGFWVRQLSLKHKQRILETEQRLNRARMNPHFFFNALSTLHSFAVRDKNPDAIASNLSKFSHIMRETLESTYKEYVTVEQETDFLNEYLDVQQHHSSKKFTYEITADKNMETDEIIIPSMIIQPFIENSIEHGFAGIDYTGEIKVQFSKKEKNLEIAITDNGSGLITERKENNEHISRASQIIKDRIYLLNIKLKTKASFTIGNAAAGKGVLVRIYLPLLYINDI